MDNTEGRNKMESSDALVFFGATGNLAHKKIFPASPHWWRETS